MKHLPSVADSAVRLTFPGTRAWLFAKVAPDLGVLNIHVNGVLVGQVNCASATTLVPHLIHETPALPYSNADTLKATISGSGKNVGIDCFAYPP